MKLKFWVFVFLCFVVVSLTACGGNNEDYIPPAISSSDTTAVVGEYNKLSVTPHKDGEPYDTYKGLVMCGYQGWFGAPGDGCSHGNQWYHYQENGMFKPGVLHNSIDFWPDMSEYEKKYTPGEFILPNGDKAQVYSAYDKSSVLLHFKWMKQYGIDGVFMQRFVGEVIDNPAGKDHFDKVLDNAMEGSNTYQRAICVMYDLGGYMSSHSRNTASVLSDAQTIMDKYSLKDRTKQKYYLYENGKPLITLWGVGFNDNRPYSLDDVKELIAGLKEKGFSIMLGVPTYWRERRNDALNDTKLTELVKSADVIMPWFVGRYDYNSYSNFTDLVRKDIQWCNSNKIEYAPLCFPGASDRNMHPNNSVVDRHKGMFLWNQLYNCIKSGAQMIYIAMFDEIDEGTAIYKVQNANNVPDDKASGDYWVNYISSTYSISSAKKDVSGTNDWSQKASDLNVIFQGIEDDLPTDHYLWITGEGAKMLRGEIPMSASIPKRK